MKLTEKQRRDRLEILSYIAERGGTANWSQLHSRGFHYMTVSAMTLAGWLTSPLAYKYEITPTGRAALGGEK